MVVLFAVTIFVGSALLFLIQPMFARMVLPLLGGSPSVWNTAMVFYQAVLLAGYAYAHWSTAWLGARRQAASHLLILAVPVAVLPVSIASGWTPPTDTNPLPALLAVMVTSVGLPFFAAATMGPTLQTWFAASGHPRARDPYFLYSSSNLGSMIALLAYPLLVEPNLSLGQQARWWTWGYAGFVVLAAACATAVWKASPANTVMAEPSLAPAGAPSLSLRRRLRWVALAFVPSSLMLGVTTYLSSEIAVVPLLWVVPLAIYLFTFVVAFRPGADRQLPALGRAFAILVVTLVVALNMQATQPLGWLMLLHLAVFALAGILCHGRLARDRPPPSQLTAFYLWIALGGVLGGCFNALLAPVIFNGIAEYPIALVLAAWLATAIGPVDSPRRARLLDWLIPLGLGAVAAGLAIAARSVDIQSVKAISGLVFGLPALGCFFLSRRPLRFALGTAALLLAANAYRGERGEILYTERSFFGLHRVNTDPVRKVHYLVHGKTLHGTQSQDPARRTEALAYYYRTGPAGQILSTLAAQPTKSVGVVGLGAGSLATYAQPGQPWTFFEIDPVVAKLARDDRYFTFLRDSPGRPSVVLGDARLSLQREPDGRFDLLLVDAFSSDAIPAHLVTREAIALYRKKLSARGVMAFHISNLHLDLEPVLAALARDAGLVCRVRDDTNISDAETALGKNASVWLVLAAAPSDLGGLEADRHWLPARDTGHPVWTDDYSSLWRIFRSF